ncbi:hypothetical protein IV203_021375 [Nitzschia inconspicua]|uniref:TAFII55 protein conserved region domain-containing protein n=1 Tax=Nitzschia inconspicua TaxID=303405 RepID=A0A9K3KH18_9STRA|nr:hypothetical protein IV203_021375 [Nitzschia inconspicua]
MGDRLPIRDRTLILRVLVPGLEQRLRDKMKEADDDAAASPGLIAASGGATPSSTTTSSSGTMKETLLDLEGVMCEPTQDGSTLWNFHCDGATYPARLVNLPCPVEVHKTHDHAMYYKSCDIAQMLIVYEDSMALDEADAYPKTEGYPSYYHSGITPPMKQVVERRFAMREHQPRAPPRNEVSDVERDLQELMAKISKEGQGKGSKRNKIPSLATAQHQNKVLEEVIEEVVEYEPWMDDYGRQQSGIEFDASDQIATVHPEIWLAPEKIREIKEQEEEKEEEERKKKEAAAAKKNKKKKKKEKAAAATAASIDKPSPSKKKGIASKKNEEPVDEVTQAAMALNSGEDLLGSLEDDDDFLDLGFDMEGLDMDGLGL